VGDDSYLDLFIVVAADSTGMTNPLYHHKFKRLVLQIRHNKSGWMQRYLLGHYKFPVVGFFVFLIFVSCGIFSPTSSSQPMPLKILTLDEGMYSLKANDLRNYGCDLGSIKPDLVKMINQGNDVPIWIEGQGSDLEIKFYGMAMDSRYTSQNPYFLIIDDQSVDIEYAENEVVNIDASNNDESGFTENANDISISTDVYLRNEHIEENTVYVPLVEEGDTWLWSSLAAPQQEEYNVLLNNLLANEGKLTLELWASTEAPNTPDHHIRASVNNVQVIDELWDGVGRYTITKVVPPGVFQDGQNTIKIEAPGDTGAVVDIVYLDWIELEYPRELVAIEDRLEFMSNGKSQRLSGFSGDVSIYEITDPYNVVRISHFETDQEALHFEGISDHKYLAIGPKGYYSPENLEPISTGLNLMDSQNAADYVVIGPSDLLEPIEPLLEHRESQGLKVISIPIDVIFDRFSYGKPEPEGINSFLRYARDNWVTPPKYVLLVGDATYDPRGYISNPNTNRVPTYMVNTTYGGETASDLPYVQFDDDMLPDLAIGRVPAQSSKQVQIFVEKLISYENHSRENVWQQKILAVADHQDPLFKAGAEAFLNQFSDEYQTELLSFQQSPDWGDDLIMKEIENGKLIVSYFGHGSIDMWGKDQLFTTEDAAGLQNQDRLPVVMTMTCLNGLFTHPEVESLAETLLWNINGGAVAVLAPSSLTVITDQQFLSRAIVNNLSSSPESSLGEILLKAQRQIPSENPGAVEVMLTFLLFGDPATQLAYP